MRITIEVHRPAGPARVSRRLVAVLLASALLVPGAVLASQQFTDVPADHTFHDDINRGYGARITTGCGEGLFCPDEYVTRGQMMAFLNRGLGRVEEALVYGVLTNADPADIGSVQIQAGNFPGGTAFVHVTATVFAENGSAVACPCEVRVVIQQGDSGVSDTAYIDLEPANATDVIADGSVTVQGVVSVPTGEAQTFKVVVKRIVGNGIVNLRGRVTAIALPFDGVGEPAPAPGIAKQPVSDGTR